VWSKPGLLLLALWGVGDAMIIFLAGLLDVPRQLYEAADIEGANGRQRFRYVTLPMISPVVFFSTVIGIIYGFQLFTQAYIASTAVTGSSVTDVAGNLGSPQNSLLFFSVYLYKQGFQDFRMGYASALAWVLFVITMVCTLAIIKGSRRWVHYQGGGFR
jgi:multiple sugar transport system permease protein